MSEPLEDYDNQMNFLSKEYIKNPLLCFLDVKN